MPETLAQGTELPLEVAELIASEQETICDVLIFSLVCRLFHEAVNGNQFVFRSHFLRIYELPREPEGYDYKLEFRRRYGEKIHEEVLRDMILDARPSRNHGSILATSPNLEHISKIFRGHPPPPALRGLLYPLQFLSPTQPLFRGGVEPKTKIGLDVYDPTILEDFRSKTDQIADSFAQCLHPSNREHSPFYDELEKLQPSELPSFWEGDLIARDTVVPSRWFGAYLYLPFRLNHFANNGLALTDVTLTYSTPTTFSSIGHDIATYTMLQGQIVEANGQRNVSWIKEYGTHRWRYEGVLEGGGQRMVGVWGEPGPNGGFSQWQNTHGVFMFWAVPGDTPDFGSR